MAKEYLNYDAIRDVQDAARQAFDKPGRKGILKESTVGARMSKTVPRRGTEMTKEYLNYDAIRNVQDAARQAFDKPDRKGMLKEFAVGARMSKTVPSVPAAVGHVVEKTAMSHQ